MTSTATSKEHSSSAKSTEASSLGHSVRHSAKTQTQIDQLVQSALAASEKITGIRPPQKELEAAMLERIQKAGTLRGRPLFYNYMGSGLGRGPYVELEDGSVKLDLINGIGIHVLGHGHPRVLAATVRGALSDVVMQGVLQANEEFLGMCNKLVQLAAKKSRLKYAWLATCGTMANENALKIARQKSRGRMIITFKNAFSGRSTMMAEITDNASFKVGLPEYNEVLRLPFYDKKDKSSTDKTLAILKEHVAKHEKNVCAFVFEPMLGEGGFLTAGKEFFLPLLDFCRSKKIPVWADEIQTFTRTGEFFAYETLGIGDYIDLCTIAKTAQNGATLYTEDMKPDAGLLGGTFMGSSAALAAGTEVLTILEEGGFMGANGKVQQIHKEFTAMLEKLGSTTCKGKISDVGGMGLMVAMTPFDGSKDKQGAFLKTAFKNGLICFGCGHDPYRVRFLLPAILTSKDVEAAREVIEKSILELS